MASPLLLLPYAEGRVLSFAVELNAGAASRYVALLAATMSCWDEAARHFSLALELNTRMGAQPCAAHTQHDYARMLLARDGPGDLSYLTSSVSQR